MKMLIILAIMFTLSIPTAFAGTTNFNSCTAMNSNNEVYNLTASFQAATTNCLSVGGQNVTIECNGLQIEHIGVLNARAGVVFENNGTLTDNNGIVQNCQFILNTTAGGTAVTKGVNAFNSLRNWSVYNTTIRIVNAPNSNLNPGSSFKDLCFNMDYRGKLNLYNVTCDLNYTSTEIGGIVGGVNITADSLSKIIGDGLHQNASAIFTAVDAIAPSITIIGLNISISGAYDLYILGNATQTQSVNLTNVIWGKNWRMRNVVTSGSPGEQGTQFNSYYDVDIRARNSATLAGINNANITIFDNHTATIKSELTNSSGDISRTALVELFGFMQINYTNGNGTNPWTNPLNTGADDGTCATGADGTTGFWTFPFGTHIPSDATIKEIEVHVESGITSAGSQNADISVCKSESDCSSTTTVAFDKGDGTCAGTTNDKVQDRFLWGYSSWTGTEIANNLTVRIVTSDPGGSRTWFLDYIKVFVMYEHYNTTHFINATATGFTTNSTYVNVSSILIDGNRVNVDLASEGAADTSFTLFIPSTNASGTLSGDSAPFPASDAIIFNLTSFSNIFTIRKVNASSGTFTQNSTAGIIRYQNSGNQAIALAMTFGNLPTCISGDLYVKAGWNDSSHENSCSSTSLSAGGTCVNLTTSSVTVIDSLAIDAMQDIYLWLDLVSCALTSEIDETDQVNSTST